MITAQNYNTKKKDIDWSKVPSKVAALRSDVEEVMEFYNDDKDIKEVVDTFLKKVNAAVPERSSKKSVDALKKIAKASPNIIIAKSKPIKFKEKKDDVISKRLSTRTQISKTKHFKKFVPLHQQKALTQTNSEELDSVIASIEKQLSEIPTKPENIKFKDSIVHAHYFYGGSDWYILEARPDQDKMFGYVILNRDSQMSELGVIYIDEIVNQGKVELDFYWKKVTLAEALHKADPDYFDKPGAKKAKQDPNDKKSVTAETKKSNYQDRKVEIRPKGKQHIIWDLKYDSIFANEKFKTISSAKKFIKDNKMILVEKKVEKVVDSTQVAHYSKDYMLIRRFNNLIKKDVAPFRTIRLIFMAFNKAAVSRNVRKSDSGSDLFSKVNKKVVALYDDVKEGKEDVQINFKDKTLLKEMEDFVSQARVNPAVRLLNSFIGLQGYKPEVKKAENLLKRISSALEKGRVDKKNRLYNDVVEAQKELKAYIKKPTEKIEPEVFGLSAPRGLCTNRIKCEGLRNDGKLRKGYKFLIGGVVKRAKAKGLGVGGIDYFEYSDKQPKKVSDILDKYDLEDIDYNDLEKLHKKLEAIGWTFDYGLDAIPNWLRPSKKKPVAKKKRGIRSRVKKAIGLSSPMVLEGGTSHSTIQPKRAAQNGDAAASVLEMPVIANEVIAHQHLAPTKSPLRPEVSNPQPSKRRSRRKMSELNSSVNDVFDIVGPLQQFLSGMEKKTEESIVVTLDAPQGAGKTRFFFQAMNGYANAGNHVAFASLEEHPDSNLFIGKRDQYLNKQAQDNIEVISDKEMSRAEFNDLIVNNDIILIDSHGKLDKYIKNIDLDNDIRKKYNGKLIFIIYQRTSDGKMRGGSASAFDADIVMKVEKDETGGRDHKVYFDKNRYEIVPGLKYNINTQIVEHPEMQESNELAPMVL